VSVEGLDKPLTADNAPRFLLYDQYIRFAGDTNERKEHLGDAARATFDAVTHSELPGPKALGEALGPVVRQGRLMFTTFDPADQAFLDRIGITGRFTPTPGADLASLRTSNANPSKIDSFLHRTLSYDATVDPATGAVRATTTIALTNNAPTSGLPDYVIHNTNDEPYGTNTMYLSYYSPLPLLTATLDGQPVGIEVQHEFGGPVYSRMVTVPSGATVVLRLEFEGQLPVADDTGGYRLDVLNQPMANDDELQVTIASSDPSRPVIAGSGLDGAEVTDGRFVSTAPISENRNVFVRFASG
jgi:hypothetical protein